MTSPTIVDTTLRDGSHAMSHRFTPDDVRAIVADLDAAGVPIIEVAHGDGLGGSSFNFGFSLHDELELIQVAADVVERAELAVLLIPGVGVATDLQRVREAGVSVARIATHCTEADISQQHIEMARKLDMTAVGFLMLAHMLEPEELVEQARKMEAYGAHTVYVTDSAGALTVDGVRARVDALRSSLECAVGIHAHNNLQLAVANSTAALEEGATWVDGTMRGLGAGAGNTPLEVLATVLDVSRVAHGLDSLQLMQSAQRTMDPRMPRPQVLDSTSLLLGYAGVYSSFLLHIEKAAQRFGVDVYQLVLELGRRKVVAGQEDMIVDVAAGMAGDVDS